MIPTIGQSCCLTVTTTIKIGNVNKTVFDVEETNDNMVLRVWAILMKN
jgi:hypothetical protein